MTIEYADLPGFAVVTVDGAKVAVKMYSGVIRTVGRKKGSITEPSKTSWIWTKSFSP